jgi:hypothetical protein
MTVVVPHDTHGGQTERPPVVERNVCGERGRLIQWQSSTVLCALV